MSGDWEIFIVCWQEEYGVRQTCRACISMEEAMRHVVAALHESKTVNSHIFRCSETGLTTVMMLSPTSIKATDFMGAKQTLTTKGMTHFRKLRLKLSQVLPSMNYTMERF